MNTVYIQLGSNKGDRRKFLKEGVYYLEEMIGTVTKKSNIYETSSWGIKRQDDYLNQVVFLRTHFSPIIVLSKAIEIENIIGRIRSKKWAPREIDIDILFYNKEVISEKDLSIPHKLLHERLFVLTPLNDIAPNFIHPIYNKRISDLLKICSDKEKVQKYEI